MAFLPDELGDQAQVVARRADGTEVDRQAVGGVAGSDASDGAATDGDHAEECVTHADGTTECSSSEAGDATDTTIAGLDDSAG